MLGVHDAPEGEQQMHAYVDVHLLEILSVYALILKIFLQENEEGGSVESIEEFIHLFYPFGIG